MKRVKGSGFTLIETLMIIATIGILSVLLIQKFSSVSPYAVEGGADMVASSLRYAKKLAMCEHRSVEVRFVSGKGYYFIDGKKKSLPNGVYIGNSITFKFNSLGEPKQGGGRYVVLTSKVGGGCSSPSVFRKRVTVVKYTGKVNIS